MTSVFKGEGVGKENLLKGEQSGPGVVQASYDRQNTTTSVFIELKNVTSGDKESLTRLAVPRNLNPMYEIIFGRRRFKELDIFTEKCMQRISAKKFL